MCLVRAWQWHEQLGCASNSRTQSRRRDPVLLSATCTFQLLHEMSGFRFPAILHLTVITVSFAWQRSICNSLNPSPVIFACVTEMLQAFTISSEHTYSEFWLRLQSCSFSLTTWQKAGLPAPFASIIWSGEPLLTVNKTDKFYKQNDSMKTYC